MDEKIVKDSQGLVKDLVNDCISRKAAIDAVAPFDDEYRIRDVLEDLPSAQSEITEEDVREWCYKRCLTIIDNALYLEMRSRWFASAQPEQRWVPCSEREPEHAGAYLVTTIVAVEKYVISSWYSPKGGWMCEDRPEAWMPLPEPYKEEAEQIESSED